MFGVDVGVFVVEIVFQIVVDCFVQQYFGLVWVEYYGYYFGWCGDCFQVDQCLVQCFVGEGFWVFVGEQIGIVVVVVVVGIVGFVLVVLFYDYLYVQVYQWLDIGGQYVVVVCDQYGIYVVGQVYYYLLYVGVCCMQVLVQVFEYFDFGFVVYVVDWVQCWVQGVIDVLYQ